MASSGSANEKVAETAYQMGAPVEGVPVKDQYYETHQMQIRTTKQGHKCCGGCCDVRRAVIIVNIIEACFAFLGMLGLLAMNNMTTSLYSSADQYDDDEVAAAMAEYEEAMATFGSIPIGAILAIQAVRVVGALAGIVGAIKYNFYLVGAAGIMYCVSCATSIVALNLGGAIMAGFFAYPHYFLVQEIRKGIMSEENYHNERQSCCCV